MNYEPTILGDNVSIGLNVKFGVNVILYGNVEIHDNTIISHNCIIGDPDKRAYIEPNYIPKKTVIGKNSFIRPFTIISQDVIVGEDFQTGDKVLIRSDTRIGNNCSMGTLCDIQGKTNIGNHVRMHSNVFLGMLSNIEDYVWLYPGVLIIDDPNPPMGILKGVTIREFGQVGAACTILPNVEIGKNAMVAAGSVVNRDVIPEMVVVGSPAKDFCSVRELRDTNGNQYLPWKDFLTDYRGLPWQQKE
jgi:acetyltransferase-like isoleucine patch superfamily enzyme